MTTRRVIIGKAADGNYKLRCALPGYDAYSDADNLMSFDSSWTDIIKIVQAGLITAPANTLVNVAIPTLGYKPYVEIRQVNGGNVINDDYSSEMPAGWQFGIGLGIRDGLLSFQYGMANVTTQLIIVYAYPVGI